MSRRDFLAESMSRGERAAMQFGESSWALAVRRLLYEHSDPPLPVRKNETEDPEILHLERQIMDIERLAIDRLYNPKIGGLKQTDHILEVGTGIGALPRYLAEIKGHTGRVDSIDITPNHYFANEEIARRRGVHNINYAYGNGEDLSAYEDGSLDLVILGFMTYHAEQPQQVFDEAWRVLRPGGLILVETRGPNNMRVTWEFQSMIAGHLGHDEDYAGILPPSPFYSDFDIRQNRLATKARFKIIHYFEQSARTGFHLSYGAEDIQTVIDGVVSLKDSFQKLDKQTGKMVSCIPRADHLLFIINRNIRPYLEYMTRGGGKFIDDVEQVFIIGLKDDRYRLPTESSSIEQATRRLEAVKREADAQQIGSLALAA